LGSIDNYRVPVPKLRRPAPWGGSRSHSRTVSVSQQGRTQSAAFLSTERRRIAFHSIRPCLLLLLMLHGALLMFSATRACGD